MELLFRILSTLLGTGINATAFGSVGLAFNMLRHDNGKERKKRDLAEEQLQRARDKWNEDRMKRFDFINKRLREQNKASTYINDTERQCLNTIEYFQKKNKAFTT